ncbi:MAG: helix-turn-helix transcriptional regulator, partial [Eubacterium sp.]|nr:helix-turn-helix transcriptional regulator [Eubacterium sp.]
MPISNYNFKISLKACRINANLKQKELADKIGVSRDTIRNWEKGNTSPTIIQLQKIS